MKLYNIRCNKCSNDNHCTDSDIMQQKVVCIFCDAVMDNAFFGMNSTFYQYTHSKKFKIFIISALLLVNILLVFSMQDYVSSIIRWNIQKFTHSNFNTDYAQFPKFNQFRDFDILNAEYKLIKHNKKNMVDIQFKIKFNDPNITLYGISYCDHKPMMHIKFNRYSNDINAYEVLQASYPYRCKNEIIRFIRSVSNRGA